MAYERIKTEHAGAKNGGGAWMTRFEAKQAAKRKRRQAERAETRAAVDAGALVRRRLLARVESGEEFVITRGGEPVVLFAPPQEFANPSPPR